MRKKIFIIVTSSIIFAACLYGAYLLGSHTQSQQIEALKKEQVTRDRSYATSLETITAERNKALNDYDAACLEYQKLYTTYDELYKLNNSSNSPAQYVSPDGARGNEDSCYR